MKLANFASLASATIGASMILGAVHFGASLEDAVRVLPGIPNVRQANAVESRFSEGEVLALAEKLAQGQIAQSVGKDREVAGGKVPALNVGINDMKLLDQAFRPNASSFTTVVGTHDLGGGGDVWTFVWELRGLSMPELKMDSAVLRVVVAVEDGTGKLRMARVSTVNAVYADE